MFYWVKWGAVDTPKKVEEDIFMKKIVVFGMILCLLLVGVMSVSAAGGGQAQQQGSKKVIIAQVPKFVGGAWFNLTKTGGELYAKTDSNVEFFQQGPMTADIALQIREVENLIEQKIDVLNIIPTSPDSVEPVLARAMREGIIVIAQEAEGMKNAHWVIEAFDNDLYGEYLMQQMAKHMNYEGDYILTVGGLTMKSHMQWALSMLRYQKANYPKMRHIFGDNIFEGGSAMRVAQERTAELLRAHPNVRGIFAGSATDAPGIALAVEEAGVKDRVVVVANVVGNVARPFLESGAMKHGSIWDPRDVGFLMAKVGHMVKNGERIYDGMNLGRPGYENVRVRGNVIFGNAWVKWEPGVTPEASWF